jgi:PIN domain nuclease of toxin-antitoxin system
VGMSVLLDTHAFVWAVASPERLSKAAREAISDATVPLLVSAVSAWEISIKHRAGRWPEVGALVRQYQQLLGRLGAEELALTGAHGLVAGGMEWEHADPFDRALAAQAMAEGLPLITRDMTFKKLPGLTVIW